MKKDIFGDTVYYAIEWSDYYKYDRFSAARVLPDMPGIIHLVDMKKNMKKDLFFFAAWREGLRTGMKNIFDPIFSSLAESAKEMLSTNLHYRYTVIDTSPSDMQDILYWMIRNYNPTLNNGDFADSKRYRDISIKEGFVEKWSRESVVRQR